MNAGDLLRILRSLGCEEVRQESSHVRIRADRCFTTVPVHKGRDLKVGILRAIERDMSPADAAELKLEPRLPSAVQTLLSRHRAARVKADELQAEAQGIAKKVVADARKIGLSVRDVAELLGLSHQRVQQLRKA